MDDQERSLPAVHGQSQPNVHQEMSSDQSASTVPLSPHQQHLRPASGDTPTPAEISMSYEHFFAQNSQSQHMDMKTEYRYS